MQKYGLDASMVAREQNARAEDRKCVIIEVFGIYARQYSQLACGIAHAVAGAYPLVSGKNTKRYVYAYGFESATFTVQVLYASLRLQAESELKLAWGRAVKEEPWLRHYTAMEKFVWKRTFLIGFINTVLDRLAAARARTVQAAADAGLVGAEVALLDRDRVIQAWADQFAGGPARTGKLSSYDSDGYFAGQSAGASANLGDDVGLSGSSRRALA